MRARGIFLSFNNFCKLVDFCIGTMPSLFLKKWQKVQPEFVTYFKEQWLDKNEQWYEGAALNYSSTNNGLESTNAIIKAEHTMRERLPVGQFLSVMVEIVNEWSDRRNPVSPNCIKFKKTPKVSLAEWTKAFQWAAENRGGIVGWLPPLLHSIYVLMQ